MDHREVKLQIWEIVKAAAETRTTTPSDYLTEELLTAAELLGLIQIDDLPKRLNHHLTIRQADAELSESQFQSLCSYGVVAEKTHEAEPADRQ